MSWLRRKGREETRTAPVVTNNYYGPRSADAEGSTTGPSADGHLPDSEQAESLKQAMLEVRDKVSFKTLFLRLIGEGGWVTFVCGAVSLIILPTEWWLVVATIFVANIATYAYVSHTYRPPVVPILKFDATNGPMAMESYDVPWGLWDSIAKIGINYPVQTLRGTLYMVRKIVWDPLHPSEVPVSIQFDWPHFSDLNFATKQNVFSDLREQHALAMDENLRLHWMLELLSRGRAREIANREIQVFLEADNDPEAALEDGADLRRTLRDIRRRQDRLRTRPVPEDEIGTVTVGAGHE